MVAIPGSQPAVQEKGARARVSINCGTVGRHARRRREQAQCEHRRVDGGDRRQGALCAASAGARRAGRLGRCRRFQPDLATSSCRSSGLGSSFLYALVCETGIDSMIATFAPLYVPSGHTGGVHGAAWLGMVAGGVGALIGLALIVVGLLVFVGRAVTSGSVRRKDSGTDGDADA